jgi:hypothetical protein
VLHPDFNFDTEEATEAANRFDIHTKAVDTGVQGLRNVFPQIRQARVGEKQSPIGLAWNPDPKLNLRNVKGGAPPFVLFALAYFR